MKRSILLPLTIFFVWIGVILWWTGGFRHFTSYSYAMYRAGTPPRNMPDLKMVDYDQKNIDFNRWKGKYILVDFMYLHCSSVCGILRSRLYDYQKELAPYLKKNLVMVSVSFDPQRDTTTILKETWRSLGAEPNWIFASLKGTNEEIINEMYKFGIVIIKTPEGDFNHTTMHYLINPDGKLIKVIDPSSGKDKTLHEITKWIQ
ncbi:MAG: SCO family protein [Spirochaetia bacterium]|nr:SCO family protein [Spirochaetia bacterium]